MAASVITGVVMAVVVSVVGAAIFGWYGFTTSGRRRLMRTRPPARILTPSPQGVRAQGRMWILVCQGICLLLVFTAVGTVVLTLTGNLWGPDHPSQVTGCRSQCARAAA